MSFAPSAGQPASTVIHTDTKGLDHGEIALPVKDGTIAAYYAAPSGQTNLPIVVVIQEIFGVHEHIKDICRRLAKEGYLAIAAELYQRQGDPRKCADIPSIISEVVSKVPDEQVYSDLDACVAWAAQHNGDASRVGVTGFCWGARLVWMYAAHSPTVKAAVAWYGKVATGHGPLIKEMVVDVAAHTNAPVLGLYGAKDASIPVETLETLRTKLVDGNEAARASEIVIYPEADHGFLADYRPMYRPAEARDAWQRMLNWFDKYL
jgi:carboxymethylenebutenolidase